MISVGEIDNPPITDVPTGQRVMVNAQQQILEKTENDDQSSPTTALSKSREPQIRKSIYKDNVNSMVEALEHDRSIQEHEKKKEYRNEKRYESPSSTKKQNSSRAGKYNNNPYLNIKDFSKVLNRDLPRSPQNSNFYPGQARQQNNLPSVRVVGQKVQMQARKSPTTSRASPKGETQMSKEGFEADSKDLESVVNQPQIKIRNKNNEPDIQYFNPSKGGKQVAALNVKAIANFSDQNSFALNPSNSLAIAQNSLHDGPSNSPSRITNQKPLGVKDVKMTISVGGSNEKLTLLQRVASPIEQVMIRQSSQQPSKEFDSNDVSDPSLSKEKKIIRQ